MTKDALTHRALVLNRSWLAISTTSVRDALVLLYKGAARAVRPETFELFVQDVVRDMTQKAGQKCTAIRRVFVPEKRVSAARDALSERLAENVVGDPAQKGVRIGPLATKGQLRDVSAGIERLKGCC